MIVVLLHQSTDRFVHFGGLVVIYILQRELLNDQDLTGDFTRFMLAQVDLTERALIKEFSDLEYLVEILLLQYVQAFNK